MPVRFTSSNCFIEPLLRTNFPVRLRHTQRKPRGEATAIDAKRRVSCSAQEPNPPRGGAPARGTSRQVSQIFLFKIFAVFHGLVICHQYAVLLSLRLPRHRGDIIRPGLSLAQRLRKSERDRIK